MAKRITVSRSQVAAAQLKEKRSQAAGRTVDAATRAIAHAKKDASAATRTKKSSA